MLEEGDSISIIGHAQLSWNEIQYIVEHDLATIQLTGFLYQIIK